MTDLQSIQKPKFQDMAETDKKIPRDLIMNYQGKPYILYAGLLWKGYMVFPQGFGIETEIIEKSPDYALVRATLTSANGVKFSNFGEASKLNVSNSMMHKYLLHLAITRASCRVLRMATACGYASYEELFEGNSGEKLLPESENDTKPITAGQAETIKILSGGKIDPSDLNITQLEAKQKIAELSKGGK